MTPNKKSSEPKTTQAGRSRGLTQGQIDQALATAPKDRELRLPDHKTPGLYLRQMPGGTPRWYLIKKVGNRRINQRLADISSAKAIDLAEARRLAQRALVDLAQGVSPLERRQQRRAARVPAEEVLAIALRRLTDQQRSPGHVVDFERTVRAFLARTRVTDLAAKGVRATAEAWLSEIDRQPLTIHRWVRHLKYLGNQAARTFDGLANPFANLEAGSATLPAPPLFTLEELLRLTSPEALQTEIGRLGAFLLLSGGRLNEAVWCRWSDFELSDRMWHVEPPSEADRAAGRRVKRNKGRTVSLFDELANLLETWRQVSDDEFVFRQNAAWRRNSSGVSIPFARHLQTLGISKARRKIHTLRHCHVTAALAAGVGEVHLRLSVGHAGPAMQAHYGQSAMRWKAALRSWNGQFHFLNPVERQRLEDRGAVAATITA